MAYTIQQMRITDLRRENKRLRKQLAAIIVQQRSSTEQAPQKRRKRIVT